MERDRTGQCGTVRDSAGQDQIGQNSVGRDWSAPTCPNPDLHWKGLWGVECILAVFGTGGP
eukprot:872416-Prorocentrum_minimum.AAC.1